MNFETRYLIRWGIPGWVFILFCSTAYYSIYHKQLMKIDVNIPNLLGLIISLGFIGVVLGYLMHQIYFSINWLFSNQSTKIILSMLSKIEQAKKFNITETDTPHVKYYKMEFEWHKQLSLLDEDQRDYISNRYRYLLSTIHGLGALLVSISTCIIFIFIILVGNKMSGIIVILILILFLLFFIVYKGFSYYSDNLIHFQCYFFDSMFSKEFVRNKRNE